MTKKSYKQKTSHLYAIWRHHKDISTKEIQGRIKNSEYGLRRQTIVDLLRGWNKRASYKLTRDTTKVQMKKLHAKQNRVSDKAVQFTSTPTQVPQPQYEDQGYETGIISFSQGLKTYKKFSKGYKLTDGQIQLGVHIEYMTVEGEILNDWIYTNAFILPDNDLEYSDLWESFISNFVKILQSRHLEGEIRYLETKTIVFLWKDRE